MLVVKVCLEDENDLSCCFSHFTSYNFTYIHTRLVIILICTMLYLIA